MLKRESMPARKRAPWDPIPIPAKCDVLQEEGAMANHVPSRPLTGRRLASAALRDWSLTAAVAAALLSFFMLFAPWVSGAFSVNAFGEGMQAAGPALIIVAVLAVVALAYLALARDDRKYAAIALIPASNLLVLYVVKLADVSDLVDLNNRLSGATASTGAGLWIGLLAAIATVAFVLVGFLRSQGRTLEKRTGHSTSLPVDGLPPPPHGPPAPPAT
ncbi:hypothetical protein OG689_42815 [Kitasatospora sp. NBC_00240]|uniref:hypothetical protein n=1 Tax=Kitasatospora sp. NBC_00240 TaxID=2903567 RepID=UPI002257AE44|nr:hypothetical protein [Kitasatospora sp. NBC_00240]MCX5215880.1 hypothetical protein [Kitasatospora sp. NBC_00240]